MVALWPQFVGGGESRDFISCAQSWPRQGRSGKQAVYRELLRFHLEPGLMDKIRRATNGGFVFGSGRFRREIAAMVDRRTWRGDPGRPPSEGTHKAQRAPAL